MKKRSILLILAVFVWLLGALEGLNHHRNALGRQRLEEMLRQTAAACYAAEGGYPPDVAYMEQRYGLRFDRQRYLVGYEMAAANLMPEITVVEVRP